MFCAACSQTTSIGTASVRQSGAAEAAAAPDVKPADTAAVPDVNTGLPTVCSSASIASSTDNECE